jgi:hypothetical protein
MKMDEERYWYELQEKNQHDYINAMNIAEKRAETKGRVLIK